MFRSHFTLSATLLATMLFLLPMTAAARTPIRGASGNGVNSNANTWNLLGRTVPRVIGTATKKVSVTRQIVCLNVDVEDSQPSPNQLLTGTCHSGVYLHLFQFTSTSTAVKVTIADLVGFKADPNFNNYGAMICDSSNSNTYELCTIDPNDPNANNIPLIPVTVPKSGTSITFTVPNFPNYPAGIDNQGKGLTLYVITQQSSALPIQLPIIQIQ